MHKFHDKLGLGDGKPHEAQHGDMQMSVFGAEGLPCSSAGWEAAAREEPGVKAHARLSTSQQHVPTARKADCIPVTSGEARSAD